MKIGIVLDQQLHVGGGFQQSLNAVEQLNRIRPNWLSIEIYTTISANLSHPALAGLNLRLVGNSWLEKLRRLLLSLSLPAFVISRLSRWKMMTALERAMSENEVDLVYFVTPSSYALALHSLPYVLTVWDLCHRDYPEFPEVGGQGVFAQRELFYRNAINRSYLTLSDSEVLCDRIMQCYGSDRERLLAMPFQPARFAQGLAASNIKTTEDLGLPKDYLFYPAQFWPHKNHARIVQALSSLKQKDMHIPVVFCGGDLGNKVQIEQLADELGVRNQIFFTGFVSEEEMQSLYLNSRGLVMPTYFGPTNLPPLEAWALGKPVIYSETLKAQAGEAALLVDPDSVSDLTQAIECLYTDVDQVQDLIKKGFLRLRQIEENRQNAEEVFLKKIEIFNSRRSCWRKI